MDEQNETPENKPLAAQEAPDDLQQFNRWMAEYGRPALVGLLVAVVALLGWTIWNNQRKAKAEAAVQALFRARAPEEFQQMAAADSKSPTAPLALASAGAEFFAARRFDESLAAYRRFLAQYPEHMLAPNAKLGIAASLEGLDDFAAAAEAYEAFAAAHAGGTLEPQAVIGAARCREQLGQFDEARALYEEYIVAHPDGTWTAQAESGLLFLKKAERASRAGESPAGQPEPAVENAEDAANDESLAIESKESAPAEEAAQKPSKPKKASKKKAAKKDSAE